VILEVDMGNTRLKWRVRDTDKVIARGHLLVADELAPLELALQPFKSHLQKLWVASVVGEQYEVALGNWGRIQLGLEAQFARSVDALCGVTNGYSVQTSLGVDRWLAVVAAFQQHKSACIVVSCGTAMTADLITAQGHHLGGYIAPGLRLLANALNLRTHQIDIAVDAGRLRSEPGVNTQAAVDGGVAAMALGLINNALRQMSALAGTENARVVLTGGDAEKLSPFYPQAIIAPDLVLDGLSYAFT
jgi:type III pantothenate kinase